MTEEMSVSDIRKRMKAVSNEYYKLEKQLNQIKREKRNAKQKAAMMRRETNCSRCGNALNQETFESLCGVCDACTRKQAAKSVYGWKSDRRGCK